MRFALGLARAAAEEIVPRFASTNSTSYKRDGSLVTRADVLAERRMRELIRVEYPSHGIVGEELDSHTGSEQKRWLLDPIDGTAAFAAGVPTFGTLIALLDGDEPVLGVVHHPITHETLYAEAGSGCWHIVGNGPASRTSVAAPPNGLSGAQISLSGLEYSEIRPEGSERVICRLGGLLRRAGQLHLFGDCIQHGLVARGRIHAAIDTKMYPWDSAAFVVCTREAGGVVSSLDGNEEHVVFAGSLITCSDRRLLEELVEELRP
jgi:histidinol-phosphatase